MSSYTIYVHTQWQRAESRQCHKVHATSQGDRALTAHTHTVSNDRVGFVTQLLCSYITTQVGVLIQGLLSEVVALLGLTRAGPSHLASTHLKQSHMSRKGIGSPKSDRLAALI